MASFCARHRIPPKTLTWWRWRLRDEHEANPVRENVRLIAVDVKQPPALGVSACAVRIGIADLDVRVEVGTDLAYVAALVEALRSRC